LTKISIFLATSALTSAAYAQQAPTAPPASTPPVHEESGDIVVTAPYLEELDILAGKSVLAGENLTRDVRTQIGDSLTRLPGVSATSFTPGASRPVLRGLQGERIRVLTDGIGSIDVSNTSADHAVTIDPLTAERIEVLRGPAVLLFGSQAIGGAVNVIDRRIPRSVPEHGYHIDLVGALGSAADEKSIGGAVDFGLGGGFVLHVDGSWRDSDDLRTGGFVLSPALRDEQLEIAEEELEEGHLEEAEEALELANLRGRIPNTQARQKSGGVGLSYIGDQWKMGLSVSKFDSNYGIPARPGAEHHHEEEEPEPEEEEEHHGEDVTIDLNQTRVDFRGEYEMNSGFLDRVTLRIGWADYEHTEFEGEEVGTVFKSNGIEGRMEFVQRDRSGWRGASGIQYFHRDFDAVGAEAFVPPNDTDQFGLFTLQEFKLGSIGLEAGGRYENTRVGATDLGITRKFNAFSAALGAFYDVTETLRIGLNGSRTERAPSAEELFSNGPHIATQAFEIGDPTLSKERSWGTEAYIRYSKPTFSFSVTGFANWFHDFIYETATGEEEDELPVFQYFQDDATYYGFEVEANAKLFQAGPFGIHVDGVADYVRAKIDSFGPAPRIPPLRLLGGIEAQSNHWDGRVEVEWVNDQDRVADFELPTDGYTMVNASIAWRPWGKARETSLILSANNIFDVEARRHASFTKDFAPIAGRDIRLSTRLSF